MQVQFSLVNRRGRRRYKPFADAVVAIGASRPAGDLGDCLLCGVCSATKTRRLAGAAELEIPPIFLKPANPKWPIEVGDDIAIDMPDAEPDPTTAFRFDV